MKNVEKIASFRINHDVLKEGIYVSRVDGDVTTYDLRTRRPNLGDYMDNLTMHSLEHMFATLVRSSKIGERVVYFGPMGCQTGFYLLVRDADNAEVLAVVCDGMGGVAGGKIAAKTAASTYLEKFEFFFSDRFDGEDDQIVTPFEIKRIFSNAVYAANNVKTIHPTTL